MSKKSRPEKKKQIAAVPAQQAPAPVIHGNVFAAFIREANSMGSELEARRAFTDDVGAFLKERGLIDDFNAWRTARYAPPATS